jgi:hypothetical protein
MTIKFASQVGTLLALVGLQSSPIKVRDVGRSVSNFDPFGLSRAGLGLSARRQGECGSMLSHSTLRAAGKHVVPHVNIVGSRAGPIFKFQF